MLDVADLLADVDFYEPFDILRRVESVIKGRASICVEEEPALGSVQPAPGKDLERLPEGDRDKETLAVYTTAELGVGQEDGPLKADGIRWRGAVYLVVNVESWPGHGYCKALCQREFKA